MNKENLRSMVWQVLKNDSWRNQFAELHGAIKALASERQLTFEKQEIEYAVNELIWELLAERVLAPTGDDKHFDFRFLQVTECGRKSIDGELWAPPSDDPGKYVERLAEQVGAPLDSIVRIYAREAILAFLSGNYFSSMVMLGIASERCIELLIKAYTTTGDGTGRKPTFTSKIKRIPRGSRERSEALRAELVKLPLPSELGEPLELQLSALFTLIRYSRDAEGEPTGRAFDRDTAHAGLLVFPQQCKWVYQLMGYFETHEV